MEGDKPRGPKAIARVLDLLLVLARERDGLTLAQVSAELGVAKPTLLDTLRSLCDQHYLEPTDGRYRLGANAYRMASKIVAAWSPSDAIRSEVKRLAHATGESVGFAIADWEIGQVIYTEAVNSTQPVRYAMQVGLRAPLYASAAGRVLLAFSDEGKVSDYLRRAHFRRLTEATRATRELVVENLLEIRASGICESYGEMLSDTAAIAAPVFDSDGKILGAMMLAAPLDRMRVNSGTFIPAARAAADRASLGHWSTCKG